MKNYAVREQPPEDILKSYPPLVRELLYARNIEDEITAEDFLNPDYDKTHDPFLLKNMDKAVERILKAVESNEKIALYTDYDCDGIPAAVVLHDFLKKINFTNFVNYIPLRNEEGYGLNHDAVESLINDGVTLIITADCGITDCAEAEFAQSKNVDVIITDHHIPGEVLPRALAVINPKQEGCLYPDKMICGSGVAFKLVQAIIKSGKVAMPDGHEKWLLDMVGLATLSDMVPLQNENRIFSYYGMKVLRKSPRVGLLKLFSSLKIDQRSITEDDITFMITPRVNAASRMGIPRDAFTLLSTTDEVEAGTYAEHLNKKNDERKGVVASMIADIKKYVKNRGEKMKNVIVHGNPEWKPSLLGLVANSFSDEHNRPVFIWGREAGTTIKGSCRAGGDTDVVRLMAKAKDVFLEYGGHTGAGGFSVAHEKIHLLEDRLNEAFEELAQEEKIISDTLIDRKLSLDDINWDTYRHIEKFSPFGLANPKPLFLFENIEVSNSKLFGKDKNHLEVKFKNSNQKDVTAIAFFSNKEKFPVSLEPGNKINLVATLEKSNFRNFPELRLRIVDIF